jgi:hypothetical protein
MTIIITIGITFNLHDFSLSLLLPFTTMLGIIDLPPFERPFTLIGDHFDKSRSFFNLNLIHKKKKGHNQQSLHSQGVNKDLSVSSSIFNPFRWRSSNQHPNQGPKQYPNQGPNQYPNQGPNQFTTAGINDNANEGASQDFNEGDDNESLNEVPNHDSSLTSSVWDFTKESMKTVLSTIDEVTEPSFFHTPKRIPTQTEETINNHEQGSNHDHDHDHHLHIPVIDNLLHHHHDHHDKQHVVYNVLIGSSYIKGVIAALLMMMMMMQMMIELMMELMIMM